MYRTNHRFVDADTSLAPNAGAGRFGLPVYALSAIWYAIGISKFEAKVMGNTDRVKQILSWYNGQNAGVLTNLARLLNHGRLAGTGKLVILPVDQGFEQETKKAKQTQEVGP